jgi:1-acyl-sn-glycerol-3-phosphate acyltransferase
MTAPEAAPPRPRELSPAAAAMARPFGFWNNASFAVFHWVVGTFLKLFFRIRIENAPRLPGAYVLAPNHSSYLDPIVLGAVSQRRISYLMTAVIHRSPWTGWFYRWNKAIPISVHGNNRDALRAARAILQQGRIIGIFPEGGISRDGGLLLGNPGAVSLVLQERVAVVPVGICGASDALPVGAGFPRRRPITIRFGAPVLPEELAAAGGGRKDRLQAATRLIMERIAALTGRTAREAELEALRRR